MKIKTEIYSKIRKKISPLRILLMVTITIAIFYWLFSKISFAESMRIIIKSNPYFILLSLIMLVLSIFFIILRWMLIIKSLPLKTGFMDAMVSIMSASSLNSVLPSKLGDIFKVYYFKECGVSKVVGTVFTERLFDIISLTLILIIGSVIINKNIFVYIGLIVLLALIFFTLGVYFLRKKSKKYNLIKNLFYSVHWIMQMPKKGLALFLLSIIIWVCSILQIYFIFLAIPIDVNFIYFSSAIIIAIFVGLIPITIAGMGTRDSAIIYLFSSFAADEKLLAVGLLFSFFRYWLLSIIGIPFLIYSINKKS